MTTERFDEEEDFQIADTRYLTEDKVVLQESFNIALHELSLLPEDYKKAVMLRDVEEMSYEDIAEMLSISMSNVKVRIHRGREMLKKRMMERGLI